MHTKALLVTLVLCACQQESEPVALDCAAYCRVEQCGGWDATGCERRCACLDVIIREEIATWYNDCGTRAACDDVKACQWPAFSARLVDEDVQTSCLEHAARCAIDVYDTCWLWRDPQLHLSDEQLERYIDCYDSAVCGDLDSCITAANPPICS